MPRPRSPCSLSARFRQKEGGLLKRWARDLIGAAERHRMSCCKFAEMQTSLGSEMCACVMLAGMRGPWARNPALPDGLGELHARGGWRCWRGAPGVPSREASSVTGAAEPARAHIQATMKPHPYDRFACPPPSLCRGVAAREAIF